MESFKGSASAKILDLVNELVSTVVTVSGHSFGVVDLWVDNIERSVSPLVDGIHFSGEEREKVERWKWHDLKVVEKLRFIEDDDGRNFVMLVWPQRQPIDV
ncbi:hypothetical protein G4B88_004877 [Cannabis sativa]|uniref:Uncharacterized protein n=1 Tax=Cannabis sativa TaxID=3483 RepID=A0A7J6EFF8_CANSA|nr:hypothetical protein G4B88_004511 [Cannabis sativa]KAF4374625.1 hypothetical protein G4B88_004877 [Cannabis sativa]